ncbi:outer membrane beta-barrel protein [Methylobacterium iners]|uniref:outer membrane beta-barrel protein n=1 Tax=Methylobacterium iners TaxID=418707 RepID=UPI001EE3539B|nr:outer membrane beta-barrel protein [Methylobacterium iners]
MRAWPTAGWRSWSLGVLGLAAALLGHEAAAQTRATPPTAAPADADAAPTASGADDGLPTLRRARPSAAPIAGAPTTGEETGRSRNPTDALGIRTGSGGNRTSGATARPDPRALTNLLRQRAAPPRRTGSATARIVRPQIQVPPPDLRLTPVVQNPVVGVPLPTTLPLAGLQTPGSLLNATLRRAPLVDEAYAPLGLRLGTFTILPSIQQSIGYDTNPEQVTRQRARGSVALRTEAELNFRSDWSASELAGELRGGYLDFPDNQAASRPNGAGNVRLRLDANRDTRVDVEGRFLLETQRAGSPDLNATVSSRPLIASYGTTVGVTENFNRLQLSLRGLVDRSEFEDARLSNGTVLSQADRNLNQFGLRVRAAYEISPVISPFIDILADTRVYDRRVDSNGIRRDSDGVTPTFGATFALTRFVAGEISAGFQRRDYVDPALRGLTAPVVNAALIWTASPLTTVRVNAATSLIETSIANSSGVFTQAATVEVQHDLLRNLSITLGAGYLASDYDRVNITEQGFSATARLDYRFNRWLTMRGSYIYQQIDSSSAGASFSANTWLLGLRVNP